MKVVTWRTRWQAYDIRRNLVAGKILDADGANALRVNGGVEDRDKDRVVVISNASNTAPLKGVGILLLKPPRDIVHIHHVSFASSTKVASRQCRARETALISGFDLSAGELIVGNPLVRVRLPLPLNRQILRCRMRGVAHITC